MVDANPHVCAGGDTLIFACSGAADVGEISDRAARKLTKEGRGKMFCLAGAGGHIQPIVDKTRAAARILAIDGCSLDCTKKTLEQIGCTGFGHVRITDLGMEKGKAPATDASIEAVVVAARPLLD
jgi:uncharacterized metal-binding protein